jgi:ribosomal protein L29
MKGLTISAQMLKFLAGLLIAIGIGFALYIFLFENYYENIADQNFAKLYVALDLACQNGEADTNFMLAQSTGLKGLVHQFFGFPGANLGSDPYFYVYYEEFPSYQWSMWKAHLDKIEIQDPISALVIPWSEDTPWTSNMMVTLAIDTLYLGMSPGYDKLKDAFKKAAGRIEAFKIANEKLKKLIDSGSIIVKGGKFVIKEAVHFTETTVAGTILCVSLTDLTLGECAWYAAWVYPALRTASYIVPKAISKFAEKIREKNVINLAEELSSVYEETADERFTSLMTDLESKGKVKQVGNKWIVDVSTQEGQEVKEALYLMAEERGGTENLAGVIFTENGDIEIDETSLKQKIKSSLAEGWASLKARIGEAFGDEAVAGNGLHTLAKKLEEISRDEEQSWKIVEAMMKEGLPVEVTSKEGAHEFLENFAQKLNTMADKESAVLLLPKDSKLLDVIRNYGLSSDEVLGDKFLEYLKEVPNDPKEAKYLFQAYKGTRYQIVEGLKETLRPYGYIWLRFQDMYTPIGATYWDKQISYYTTTGTYCGEGYICLQKGYHVTRLPLPDSCKERGIKNIKLERGSVVAPNPRFYLVSPCFAKLHFYVKPEEPDTVYVKPMLCNDETKPEEFKDVPNYCYATEGVVNFYTAFQVGSWFGDCIAALICATTGDITEIAKCLTLGISPSDIPTPCSILGNSVRMFFDVTRESLISYPYISPAIMGNSGACSW